MTTHTDRELLELAAKAANLNVVWDEVYQCLQMAYKPGYAFEEWNPLADDGDALRLLVLLRLDIIWAEHEKSVLACNDSSNDIPVTEKVRFTTDPYAATRRAIVRAAAEIGGIAT